jgi:hypothetical protein
MIVGVKEVICTCGKPMLRTGGVFGEICTDTYLCKTCDKAVNIITLPKESVDEMNESLHWRV